MLSTVHVGKTYCEFIRRVLPITRSHIPLCPFHTRSAKQAEHFWQNIGFQSGILSCNNFVSVFSQNFSELEDNVCYSKDISIWVMSFLSNQTSPGYYIMTFHISRRYRDTQNVLLSNAKIIKKTTLGFFWSRRQLWNCNNLYIKTHLLLFNIVLYWVIWRRIPRSQRILSKWNSAPGIRKCSASKQTHSGPSQIK